MSDSPETTERPFAHKAIAAAKWNYIGNGARVLAQFVVGLVLARIVGPHAFGLIAVGWLMIGMGKLFSDLGFSAALIQAPELTDDDIHSVFTYQLLIGLLLTLVGIGASPYLAEYVRDPATKLFFSLMSALFLLQALSQVPTALLSRALDFKLTQSANIWSYLAGYVLVGIPCAYMGLGAWSLLWAQLIQAALYAALVFWFSRIQVRLSVSRINKRLATFGGKVIGANLASWVVLNADSLLVGKIFGVVDLGLYNRASALANTPLGAMTTSLQSVMFAGCSRAQGEPRKIREMYLGISAGLAYIVFAIFFTVAAVPTTVIVALYGPQWTGAAMILSALSIAMCFHALLAIIGPVLMAVGKVELELHAQLVTMVLMIPALYVAGRFSVASVAWAVSVVYGIRCFLLMRAIAFVLQIRSREFLHSLAWPFGCACVVAIVTWQIDRIDANASAPLRLAIAIGVAAAVSIGLLRLVGPTLASGSLGVALSGSPGKGFALLRRWLRVRGV